MKLIYVISIIIAALLGLISKANANYYSTINLNGKWKFSIGDNPQWANPTFKDADWDVIYVPARWEEQGYQGYNGIAWYRNRVNVPQLFSDREIFLELGYIDDCDEVFFNGEKIGQSGEFPPNNATAYNSFRKYLVPSNLIKYGQDNLIAVRVYDSQLEGGIVRGDVRLCAGEIAINPDINLNGSWLFNAGWKTQSKKTIQVPGNWENQGFYDYDGIATYSKTVKLNAEQLKKKWIFVAGRIDDDDEFYINGQLIAKTGDFKNYSNTDMHNEFRNYFIPEGTFKAGDNLIEIKVIDRGGEGGIIEGNIGLITQENFIKYWRLKRK